MLALTADVIEIIDVLASAARNSLVPERNLSDAECEASARSWDSHAGNATLEYWAQSLPYGTSPRVTPERLADLLVDPREDLDLEAKNWLDLKDNKHDKAIFAKSALALANHGGGFIVLGLEECGEGLVEAADRPVTLERYDQDLINGIVRHYCDPPFHCSVHLVPSPKGAKFPIVKVPGGHRVPVSARRAGPGEKTVQLNVIYIRKPGPRSEPPKSGQEWDSLLSRCLANRRDEMLGYIRSLLIGATPQIKPIAADEGLKQWIAASFDRWSALIDRLPENVGPRFPHGYYNFAYEIVGPAKQIPLAQLAETVRASVARYTGWPPFWYPTRRGIKPYLADGTVECWLGGDPDTPAETRDAAHSDFWRIAPEGRAYLLRGYQEDSGDFPWEGQREPSTGNGIRCHAAHMACRRDALTSRAIGHESIRGTHDNSIRRGIHWSSGPFTSADGRDQTLQRRPDCEARVDPPPDSYRITGHRPKPTRNSSFASRPTLCSVRLLRASEAIGGR